MRPPAGGAGRRAWRIGPPTSGPAGLALGFAVPLAAAGIMVSIRTRVADTDLALIMVAVVVATVAPGRRALTTVTGLSAGVWFDFFLTRPYQSFSIRRSVDVQTTVLIIAVAIAVGEIATRNRQQRDRSTTALADLSGVQTVSRLLATGAAPATVVATVCEELRTLLALESCRFVEDRRRPVPYVDRDGSVRFNNFAWDATTDGLPDKVVNLPVAGETGPLGRFELHRGEVGVPIPRDRLRTALALADLTGVAIGATPGGPAPHGPLRQP